MINGKSQLAICPEPAERYVGYQKALYSHKISQLKSTNNLTLNKRLTFPNLKHVANSKENKITYPLVTYHNISHPYHLDSLERHHIL